MYESGELLTALGLEDTTGAPAPEPDAREAAPLTIENRL
jgi:hypothetical protein